jgi:hypothetical protein
MTEDKKRFSGQWIGEALPNGTNSGFIICNIQEKSKDELHGEFFFQDYHPAIPSCGGILNFEINTKGEISKGIVKNPLAYNAGTGNLFTKDELCKFMQLGGRFPTSITIDDISINNSEFKAKFVTDINTSSNIKLHRYKKIDSPLKVVLWSEFKRQIEENFLKGDFIFRGQKNSSFPLRSTFFRSNRCDLKTYTERDVPKLQNMVQAFTDHRYDLKNSEDYGALLNLARHHGYPAPILDWTKSHYIAAFFAFCECDKTDDHVRIFTFNTNEWFCSQNIYSNSITDPRPNITMKELNIYQNTRPVLQQAVQMFSNIDDIEWFIRFQEQKRSKNYLDYFDISTRERDVIMKDLRIMGITHATMYGGLDGVFRSLKEELFT